MISYANIFLHKKNYENDEKNERRQKTNSLCVSRTAFYLPINKKNISFPGSIMMTSNLWNVLFPNVNDAWL